MQASQANVEYFFRLLYNCFHGACYGSLEFEGLIAWLAHLWLWIIYVGYIVAIIALIVLVYSMVRLFELREREHHFYSTLITPDQKAGHVDKRWDHIQSLAESATASDWRTAIIEADIMLDDLLTKEGYTGEGVGEKLKSVDAGTLRSLQDAWEAHKVRNQIAHQGSAFDLSDTLAQRTIAQYENVFKEFHAI